MASVCVNDYSTSNSTVPVFSETSGPPVTTNALTAGVRDLDIMERSGFYTLGAGCIPVWTASFDKLPVLRTVPRDLCVATSWPTSFRTDLNMYIYMHTEIFSSGLPNYLCCKLPVPSVFNIEFWRSELVDYHDYAIVDFLQFGWPLGYTADRLPACSNRNHNGALQFSQHIDDYISKEISLMSVLGPFDDNPFMCPLMLSPLNTVPKSGGNDRRVILDLSFPDQFSVNDGIPTDCYLGSHFVLNYPTVDTFADMIIEKGMGCMLFKRDLRRAYRQIPVDPGDLHLLGYTWHNKIFVDNVLAMGLRSAAMMCQRMTAGIVHMCSQDGLLICNYIDDFAGAEIPESACAAYEGLGDILISSGLQEAPEKAIAPTTRMVFLGVTFDSVSMTREVTVQRLCEIAELITQWLLKSHATKQQLQSLIGKLQFVAKCVQPGRLFVSRLLNMLPNLRRSHHRFRISNEFRKDLLWWRRFLETYNGVSIIPDRLWSCPDDIFASDACLSGCGAVCGLEYFHCTFPAGIVQRDMHINALELLVILVSVKLWCAKWAGKRIVIKCDNAATVSVINSGRCRDASMLSLLRELSYHAAVLEFQLRAVHIPGQINRVPDCLSRWHFDSEGQSRKFQELTSDCVMTEVKVVESLFYCSADW